MADVSPVQIQKYLSGVNYPADKKQIIKKAQSEGADQQIISTLQQLPDQEFETPADISEAIGNIE